MSGDPFVSSFEVQWETSASGGLTPTARLNRFFDSEIKEMMKPTPIVSRPSRSPSR